MCIIMKKASLSTSKNLIVLQSIGWIKPKLILTPVPALKRQNPENWIICMALKQAPIV